jgi:hypothetical protein
VTAKDVGPESEKDNRPTHLWTPGQIRSGLSC